MRKFFTWRRVLVGFAFGFLAMFVWIWLWDSFSPVSASSIVPSSSLAKAFIGGGIGSTLIPLVWGVVS